MKSRDPLFSLNLNSWGYFAFPQPALTGILA